MLQVKQALNHAFYLKEHSTIEDYLKFLDDSYTNLKTSKEDIWEIVKLIVEISISNARTYEKNKLLPLCYTELNRAWKVLHPINPRWKEKVEWQLLRFTVFSHLAEYYRK